MNATSFDEVSIPPVKGIEISARRHLREDYENATRRVEKGKFVHRNFRGRSILEDLDAMKRQIDILFSKHAIITGQLQKVKRMNEEHQKKIIALEGQVGRLTQTSGGYFCTYQKDIKDNEGDALADAFLFDHDHRPDNRLYRELYGLEYRQVLEMHSTY